jgi:cytidine deaminase
MTGAPRRRPGAPPGMEVGIAEFRALEDAARQACVRSRALGCRHPRGAALLTTAGAVHAAPEVPDTGGCAVGQCAERAALYAALMAGCKRFRLLLLRGGTGRGDAGPPCGPCLQVLAEFAPGLRVFWGTAARPQGGLRVRELLPGAFGPGHLAEGSRRPRNGRRRKEARS